MKVITMNKKEALALFKEGCPFCGSRSLNIYRDVFKKWHIECECVFCTANIVFENKADSLRQTINKFNTRNKKGTEYDRIMKKE